MKQDLYCITVHFFFRVEIGAGINGDEDGNEEPLYIEQKIGHCKKTVSKEDYVKLTETAKNALSKILEIDSKYLTPITLEEYKENTEELGE